MRPISSEQRRDERMVVKCEKLSPATTNFDEIV